ncbi:fatty acid desaturase family protein [Pontivivens ytuae]|uniref:Fatty acid desaturase family protein n=1 Tax=Pontivivens ytuae TaxID=2789856 RepID=A0A7S9LTT0_9RHOB|nr:fatty acid desaturase family protein [Pontivivens ytuae]QPH54994.1 fatty acid desaturase family protein [Pontivivens ytuae]
MQYAKQFLSSEDIRPLAERSNITGALLLLHCYGIIAAAIALFALWPNPLTFLLAVMLIGSRQLGLAILMHEAAHNALFRNRKVNEFAGRWLCGHPIMADMVAYRHYHLTHHRFTQTEKDPDLKLSAPFPTTRASLIRKFVRDLTGQTGVKQLVGQIVVWMQLAGDHDAVEAAEAEEKMAQAFKGLSFGTSLAVNAGIIVALGLVGDWWWGLAFWLLPLLTWLQLVLRLRNIAEHGATEASDNPLQNVRTTLAGPLWRLFVAPYWVNYHLEHHLVMHMPAYNLPKLHKLMVEKGYGDKMRVAPSYWKVLGEVGWRNRTA